MNDKSGVIGNKLLYANVSAILLAEKDISTAENSFQPNLQIVSEWMIDNKITLHLGKTESISLGSKLRIRRRSHFNIECKAAKFSKRTKFGAILDQTLTEESMVNSFLQNANTRLKFFFYPRHGFFLFVIQKNL